MFKFLITISALLVVSPAFSAQFETGKSSLTPESEASLESVAETLKDHKVKRVVVEGHADVRGSKELNDKLSLKRAETAAGKLQELGLKVDEVQGKGFSEATGNNDKDRKIVTRFELEEKVVTRTVTKTEGHKNILSLFAQEVRNGLRHTQGQTSATAKVSPVISPGLMYQRRVGQSVYLGGSVNTEGNVAASVGLGW
jgi:hypothetical protein